MIPWYIGQRKLWFAPHLDDRDVNGQFYGGGDMDLRWASYEEANLVSSLVNEETSTHMPVLDLDFPCALVPSTTEGHFHLYMNKEITWRQYRRLLRALHAAGIIEKGFCLWSVKREMAFVRRPGVKKGSANDIQGRGPGEAQVSH